MTKKKIGILGSGQVAKVLATGFLTHGFEVMVGTRNPGKLADWKSKNTSASIGSFEEAAGFGDVIVLAVKGTVAESLVISQSNALGAKTVLDTTNPIAEAAPENGVLKYFTSLDNSLMERLQKAVPTANFVKVFSCVGSALMVSPSLPGGRATMFICGNNEDAKNETRKILDLFGWDVADMGKVESARAIEPLCILWCIPGLLHNQWQHARPRNPPGWRSRRGAGRVHWGLP